MGDKSPKSKARNQKQHEVADRQKKADALAKRTPITVPPLKTGK